MGPRLLVVGPAEKVCRYEGHAHWSGRQRDTRPRGARVSGLFLSSVWGGLRGTAALLRQAGRSAANVPCAGPLVAGRVQRVMALPG